MEPVATVAELWTYPVKSMQGSTVDAVDVGPAGIAGDRRWALIQSDGGFLLSAKRRAQLLEAAAAPDGDTVVLPDGTAVDLAADDASAALSAWLGASVEVRSIATQVAAGGQLLFEMTFDPPNDDAEYYEIPAPPGSFLDAAAVHVVHAATLAGCAAARPDLDWSVRRFRPNVVLDGALDAPFAEQGWVGRSLRFGPDGGGGAILGVQQPTVRCAMPLRAQPGGIPREPGIFSALSDLNTEFPNHLGLYLSVVQPGTIRAGDEVTLVD